MGNKHSGLDRTINNISQINTSMERRGLICLNVERKYQKPLNRNTDCTLLFYSECNQSKFAVQITMTNAAVYPSVFGSSVEKPLTWWWWGPHPQSHPQPQPHPLEPEWVWNLEMNQSRLYKEGKSHDPDTVLDLHVMSSTSRTSNDKYYKSHYITILDY